MIDLSLLGDIDIDTGDRNQLLSVLEHIPATVDRNGKFSKHNTGVYFHQVPTDPFSNWCSLNYQIAQEHGCYKIDVLNNHVYSQVRDESHLNHLLETPPMWELLHHEDVVKELVHINQHFDLVNRLRPTSVKELAMVLAMIRPGKRHLVNKCARDGWDSIADEIYTQDNRGYTFKKSHAISLSMVIVIQLNLLIETITQV